MDSDFTTGMVVLSEILDHENLTISMLGEKLGLNRPQALYDINNGKTQNISAKMADKIISAFPHYNRSWLMSGEGEMLKDAHADEAPQKPYKAPHEVETTDATNHPYRGTSGHRGGLPIRQRPITRPRRDIR